MTPIRSTAAAGLVAVLAATLAAGPASTPVLAMPTPAAPVPAAPTPTLAARTPTLAARTPTLAARTPTLTAPVAAAPVVYEAELATIVNGAAENSHPGFTGTGYVNSANAVGAAVEFAVNSGGGSETLVFRYVNGATCWRCSP